MENKKAFLREEGGPPDGGGRSLTDVVKSRNIASLSLSLALLDSSLPEGALILFRFFIYCNAEFRRAEKVVVF